MYLGHQNRKELLYVTAVAELSMTLQVQFDVKSSWTLIVNTSSAHMHVFEVACV